MNLLDRYIFRSVFLTCLASVALFAFVLLLGNAIRDLLSYYLSGQLSLLAVGELVLLLLPFVIIYALPMGVLTGVLLVLGRLSADSEITAMRANGLGIARIARPILLLGLAGALLGVYANFQSMPRARTAYQNRLVEAVRADPLRFIVPRTIVRDFPGYVVYVGERQGAEMRDFLLWKLNDEGSVVRYIRAKSGRIDYDAPTNSFLLTLTRAQVEERMDEEIDDLRKPAPIATFQETDEPIALSLDSVLGRSTARQKLNWMTFEELQAERDRLAATPASPENAESLAKERMQVAMVVQDKLTTAVAVFSFALVGVPLGIRLSRRETSAGLGVATALALGYYFLVSMIESLESRPALRPDLLYWIPNLIFIGLGIWLFSRADRR